MIGTKPRLGVTPLHEIGDAVDQLESGIAVAAQGQEQLRLAGRLPTEARVGHLMAETKGFDRGDQIGSVGDIHAPADKLANAYNASSFCKLSLISPNLAVLANTNGMPPSDPLTLFDRLMAVKPDGLSRNAWALRAGLSRVVFADIKRRGGAKHETIEKLLEAIGITWAQFDAGDKADRKDPPPPEVRAPTLAFRGDDRPRDVPILGTSDCADFEVSADGLQIVTDSMSVNYDEVIDYARRPAALDHMREVYGVYHRLVSMVPRFEPGEFSYVNPKQPPRIGDYVVVQIKGPDGEGERIKRVMTKRLTRMSASFVELEQFNPPLVFRVDRKSVEHIHRIMPWDELVAF